MLLDLEKCMLDQLQVQKSAGRSDTYGFLAQYLSELTSKLPVPMMNPWPADMI